jgi:DNA-binding MarR family transcriptional regulator
LEEDLPSPAADRDMVDVVETEFTWLARTIESMARRSSLYDGMDRASYLILRTLSEGGPASVNALAERLGVDGSTVTRQTAAMEARGLIEREPDRTDRRASIVTMTDAGRARMNQVRRLRQEQLSALFEAWGSDDLSDLGRILRRLNETLADHAMTFRRSR